MLQFPPQHTPKKRGHKQICFFCSHDLQRHSAYTHINPVRQRNFFQLGNICTQIRLQKTATWWGFFYPAENRHSDTSENNFFNILHVQGRWEGVHITPFPFKRLACYKKTRKNVKTFFAVRVVEHWYRFPRVAVKSPSLQISKPEWASDAGPVLRRVHWTSGPFQPQLLNDSVIRWDKTVWDPPSFLAQCHNSQSALWFMNAHPLHCLLLYGVTDARRLPYQPGWPPATHFQKFSSEEHERQGSKGGGPPTQLLILKSTADYLIKNLHEIMF